MLRTITSIFLALCCLSFTARAQYAYEPEEFEAKQLIAPGALLAGGTLIHCFAHNSLDASIDDYFSQLRSQHGETVIDDYTQYLPIVAYFGLDLLGAESEHGLTDHLVEGAISYVALVTITRSMKAIINSPRPNGVDNKSFPSGHTGTVFTGAELVRKEYGWGWGAAAYAVATGTAVMRMYNHEHWFSDLLAGASIGILSANIGSWLREPCKDLLGIRTTVATTVDPVSGALCAQLAFRF